MSDSDSDDEDDVDDDGGSDDDDDTFETTDQSAPKLGAMMEQIG